MTVRLGTRKSILALTQSRWVAQQLSAYGIDIDIVPIETEGDTNTSPLRHMGGVGVFASALRLALLDNRCDIAVHSLKDLPVAPCDGLTLAAIPRRESPVDVLVTTHHGDLSSLPPDALVGTGSPRRIAQLRMQMPDVRIVEIRGNIDSRIKRVTTGELDAVILAQAGLNRLGHSTLGHQLTSFLPAPGQGALAVETRESTVNAGGQLAQALATLDDEFTRREVTAERQVLAYLGAGCAAPIGALGQDTGGHLFLEALVASEDGQQGIRAQVTGVDPLQVGTAVAQQLLEYGANAIADLHAQRSPR